jgi:hypothetical protein
MDLDQNERLAQLADLDITIAEPITILVSVVVSFIVVIFVVVFILVVFILVVFVLPSK